MEPDQNGDSSPFCVWSELGSPPNFRRKFGGDKKIAAPEGAAIRLPFQSTVPTTKQMMEHTSMNANSAKVTFLSTPSLPFSLFLP